MSVFFVLLPVVYYNNVVGKVPDSLGQRYNPRRAKGLCPSTTVTAREQTEPLEL
jgi:hypothetical protein